MLFTALRDLQWRRRRFMIGVLGTSLVFAMSLLLSGLSTAFRGEASRFVAAVGADLWVVKQGTDGPLTTFSPLDAALVGSIRRLPGVRRAEPMVFVHQTVDRDGTVKDVNVAGTVPGSLGEMATGRGHPPVASGEASVNEDLGLSVGDQFDLAGEPFTVTGLLDHSTLLGGQDVVQVTLADAQRTLLGGLTGATVLLVDGQPTSLPDGLVGFSASQVRHDLLRPLGDAQRSIDFVRVLLWLVAASIVGSIVYLSALERTRDFAVLKAVGTSTAALAAGLALQAILLALAAAVLAAVLAIVLAPVFPLPVEIPLRALLFLPLVAVAVGLAASLFGLRRAVKVPPAVAFGGP